MKEIIESIRKSLRLVVGKCVLSACVKDANGMIADITILGRERHTAIRMLQQYGFASVPDDGSEAVALFVGGSRDNGVVIATQGEASVMPSLDKGEVALFSRHGQKIVLRKDGTVEVEAASEKDIIFKSSLVVDGDIESSGGISAKGDIKGADLKTDLLSFSSHIHTAPPSGGSTSGPEPAP